MGRTRHVIERCLAFAGILVLFLVPHSTHTAAGQTAVTLTVDGAVRFQQIDGFGVNINSNQWHEGWE